jgi:hypothetical protein
VNMAHGMTKQHHDRKILAITDESAFLHSGLPAFVNTLYNDSSYVLLIMTGEREEALRNVFAGCGFHNIFHIDDASEIIRFKDKRGLAVVFCEGKA